MVLEQTERYQKRRVHSVDFQWSGYQVERGHRKNEEDQVPQRAQTLLGTKGQRTKDQVYRQNWKNFGSHQEEVIQ